MTNTLIVYGVILLLGGVGAYSVYDAYSERNDLRVTVEKQDGQIEKLTTLSEGLVEQHQSVIEDFESLSASQSTGYLELSKRIERIGAIQYQLPVETNSRVIELQVSAAASETRNREDRLMGVADGR